MTNIISFKRKQDLFHNSITPCENLLTAISEVGHFSDNHSQKILRNFFVAKSITQKDKLNQLHKQYEEVFKKLQAVIVTGGELFVLPYTYDETPEIYPVLEITQTKDIQSFITSSMYLFTDKVDDYANEYPQSVKYQSEQGEVLYCPLKTSNLDIQNNLSLTGPALLNNKEQTSNQDKILMVTIVRKVLDQQSKQLLEDRMNFLHIFLDELTKAHARVADYVYKHPGYDELITYSNKEQKRFTDAFHITTLDKMIVDTFILSGSQRFFNS